MGLAAQTSAEAAKSVAIADAAILLDGDSESFGREPVCALSPDEIEQMPAMHPRYLKEVYLESHRKFPSAIQTSGARFFKVNLRGIKMDHAAL